MTRGEGRKQKEGIPKEDTFKRSNESTALCLFGADTAEGMAIAAVIAVLTDIATIEVQEPSIVKIGRSGPVVPLAACEVERTVTTADTGSRKKNGSTANIVCKFPSEYAMLLGPYIGDFVFVQQFCKIIECRHPPTGRARVVDCAPIVAENVAVVPRFATVTGYSGVCAAPAKFSVPLIEHSGRFGAGSKGTRSIHITRRPCHAIDKHTGGGTPFHRYGAGNCFITGRMH